MHVYAGADKYIAKYELPLQAVNSPLSNQCTDAQQGMNRWAKTSFSNIVC